MGILVCLIEMKIREIVEADLAQISQLYVSVFNNPPWNEDWKYDWAYDRLNWIYRSQGFIGILNLEKNQVNGAILGHFVPFKGRKGFKIVEFLVDTNCQNKGIGTKLLIQLESNLKQQEYDFVLLLTAKDTAVESFYLKRNYRRDNRLALLRHEL